jgi:hypothetical protein
MVFYALLDELVASRFNKGMSKQKILIQLDSDSQASVFDAVVAIDAGVDHLLQHSGVTVDNVRSLVHGAMYTRGPSDLKNTAIFIGGTNVNDGEAIAAVALESFLDPFRVSIMLDSNGANSTAAATVLCATRHLKLERASALVMAATGSVGQRVCQILANEKCFTYVASRSLERSQECIRLLVAGGANEKYLKPLASSDDAELNEVLSSVQMVFGCGAAGAGLLNESQLSKATNLKVAIDLNAVPPSGIAGITIMDKGKQRGERFDYGALGVGGLKMKIHKASLTALFHSNNQFLDCQEMLAIGEQILRAAS